MTIDVKAKYRCKVGVSGICEAGTRLRVWTIPNVTPPTQMVGAKNPDKLGFNLPSGGGVFFKEEEVELDK